MTKTEVKLISEDYADEATSLLEIPKLIANLFNNNNLTQELEPITIVYIKCEEYYEPFMSKKSNGKGEKYKSSKNHYRRQNKKY